MWYGLVLVSIMTATAFTGTGKESKSTMELKERIVVDFREETSDSWRAINDGVMGGLSQSGLSVTKGGVGVFSGHVSLANNGGFASIRSRRDTIDISEFDGLVVRVKGDGNRYRLRLRTDERYDGIAYQAKFDTTRDEWRVVEIPFDSFLPTYRGRTVRNAPPLDTTRISQIGFMIADKQEGSFRIDIEWVRAYSDPRDVEE
jgi:monofunctional biosynthetic peptidoglycan transglycosylase